MKETTIRFPVPGAWEPTTPHSLDRGDEAMELKQVHPEYANDEEKQKQMEDAYRACLTKIGILRSMQKEKTA